MSFRGLVTDLSDGEAISPIAVGGDGVFVLEGGEVVDGGDVVGAVCVEVLWDVCAGVRGGTARNVFDGDGESVGGAGGDEAYGESEGVVGRGWLKV